MKKRWLIISVLLIPVIAFAATRFPHGVLVNLSSTDTPTYAIEVQNTSGTRIFSVDSSGNTYVSGTMTATTTRNIQLPLGSFLLEDTAAPLTTSTVPGMEIDDGKPALVWADGETSSSQITFRVPYDYSSGGAFKLMASESDSTTPNQVDFAVLVDVEGVATDTSATNQTPVALAGTTATPDEITLTVATDFASLAAGNYVTLEIWRDDAADGTGDLELRHVVFSYTASQ